MSRIFISKLLKTSCSSGDTKHYVYLQTEWEDHQVNVKLLDSESGKCYQGIIKATAIKEIAVNLDMPFNDYYEEMRLALTTYLTLPGFYYKLEHEMKVFNVWKSQPESIPLLFLDINIKEIKNSNELLDSAVELLHKQKESLTDRIQKAHKFDERSRELLEDYRLCVEEKSNLERKLLKKVAVLLNSKKERISQLEKRLKKYEEVDDIHENGELEENDEPQTSKKRRLVIDSETDDDEYMAETQPLTPLCIKANSDKGDN